MPSLQFDGAARCFLLSATDWGRKGRQTVHATQIVRTFLATGKAKSCSVGLLYLDLEQAFYTLVRQAATGVFDGIPSFESLLEKLPIANSTRVFLLEYAQSPTAAHGAIPEGLRQQLQAWQRATWFRIPATRLTLSRPSFQCLDD